MKHSHLRRCAVCGSFHFFYDMFTVGTIFKLNVCRKCKEKREEAEKKGDIND